MQRSFATSHSLSPHSPLLRLPIHTTQVGFLVLSALVLVSIAVPIILPVFLPLAAAFYVLRARYLRASREVKRWEAVTR